MISMATILYFTHYALLLLSGAYMTAAFAGIKFTKKNTGVIFGMAILCGFLQILFFVSFGETMVWKMYPLITHLPLVILLSMYYHKRMLTSLAAVTTAYLCCQPAKWIGLFIEFITDSFILEQLCRIAILAFMSTLAILCLASFISELFIKDTRSILSFVIIPVTYYLYDYCLNIYSSLWIFNSSITAEFLPFIVCIAYLVFCVIYYREYENKTAAERMEQLIRITVEQQAKELETIKHRDSEIRILRHDMRLFLDNLSICIEEADMKRAKKMLSGFISNVEATSVHRYCENDIVNYILSHHADKCAEAEVAFTASVKIHAFDLDEILFSSILSNALDNALNAQKELPPDKRNIKLKLETSNGKLLLSVKNPFAKKPVFVDGMPLSSKKGHGYGTQSIRHMTERMGGNCQFTTEGELFILRVVL